MSSLAIRSCRHFLVSIALAGIACLVACGQHSDTPVFQATDITGAKFGHDFELVDFNGKQRHLADFRGKVVVMFFGYTHCPDVCPTTLAEFNAALKQLGDAANRVQVLFVSVDPKRDTPDLLRGYVTAFNEQFLGLTGTPEQIAKVAKEYKIVYQKVPGSSADNYSVDHSAGTYIYDEQGHLRLFAPYGLGGDAIASDIAQLLKAG